MQGDRNTRAGDQGAVTQGAKTQLDLDWHALEGDEVERALGASPDGLSSGEAERRLEIHGLNLLEEAKEASALSVLLHQFKSPLIYILLVAGLVTLALGEEIDAAVISAVLVFNAAIGFFQERRAERSVRALMQLAAPRARVVREGREREVASRELVPGDIVLLESGARVPADLRLIGTIALSVDESMLTGESVPVGKRTPALDRNVPMADRTNMAYMGTIVAAGRGRGYVVATGAHTELGAIATSVREEESPKTPLQHRMDRFARVVGIVVLVSAVAAFGAGVAMGNTAAEMFKVAVALAVSAIPEGLPVVFTIALALGVRRMARRNAIIRRLPAVETLGSTTVIGSDKTGTLTENRMTVQEIWAGGRFVDVDEAESTEPGGDPLRLTMLAGVLTNEAEAYRGRDGLQVKGDPTEAALLVAAARLVVEPPEVRARYQMVAEIPFEPERRYSASVREREGDHLLFVKGAPERVATMCEQILTDDGPRRLDHEEVHRAAREMAGRGLRVLAMAYKELSEPPVDRDEGPVVPPRERLVFLGLQGMLDPPREGVKEAIAACRSAGIRVVMITGDHAVTARSIAVELGITPADPEVLTGVELEDLDDDGLRERVATVSVYARVSPEHKLRVVRALRARGEVVAVTGDGVNDAPALKAADIGVAMGKSGTDVAREASDMVLSDDNFVSIRAAVEEGRVTFDNVRKVTFFLISSGAAEVLTIVTALLLGWPLPLLAVQILWLNLVTNGIQDVALAFEPGEPDVLQRPPRHRLEGVVSALLWERTVVAGAVMATGVLVLYRWELDHGAGLTEARTVALTTMVLFQALHAGNSRSEHRSVFAISPFSNRFLLVGVLGALAIHAVALYLPVTRFVLRVEPLAVNRWLEAAAVALSIIVAIEIHKLVRRRARPREGGGS